MPKYHIATVHWKDSSFIKAQVSQLHRYLGRDNVCIYAFLNEIDSAYDKYFDYIDKRNLKGRWNHPEKLNDLASVIMERAENDEIILFIDGDAFPIAPIDHLITDSVLGEEKLVAVKRLENDGDPQPHPCFCATSVQYWREIGGNWMPGPEWIRQSDGSSVSDVGGRLWKNLSDRNVTWKALLRSNQHDIHPLWFGIYGDAVYHHGAGFRKPMSRADNQVVESEGVSREEVIEHSRDVSARLVALISRDVDRAMACVQAGKVPHTLKSYLKKFLRR